MHRAQPPASRSALRLRDFAQRLVLPLAVATFLPACDGCHKSKPYTPYGLSDSSAPSATAHAGAPGDAGGVFAAVTATPAVGDGKSWPLEAGAVEPPAGHAFVEGLVADMDGDGTPDLVAWSRSPDGARGELWFASGKSPANGRILSAIGGSTCKAKQTLSQVSPGMIVFDVDARCEASSHERSSRIIEVFRRVAGGPPELGLELRQGPLADGEALGISLDGRDRDGDGRGDLTATFTLESPPKPLPAGGAASASVAFFDRPAGLSRDPAEPEASFKALATAMVADGRKKTTAGRVAANARAALLLHGLLCEEAGRAVVTTSAGPIRCGEARLGEDAAIAETEAAQNLGDPIDAMAAAGRLEARRKDVDGLLAKLVPAISGKLVRATAASPDVLPPPSFGPVAILSTGDVLVRTKDRIIRVDHASFQESPVDAAIAWPSRLTSPGWTLLSIEERCDAPLWIARFQTGSETSEVPLPVLAGRCTAGSQPSFDLLGSSTQGALVAVRGEVLAIPVEAPPRPVLAEAFGAASGAATDLGAGRSANGQVLALSTSRGILVATLKGQGRAATAKLWTTPALDGASACVPSDAADRIACVVKGAKAGVAIYDAK